MARLEIDVTVGSLAEARSIAGHTDPDDPVLAVHLEVDTGMTRGGITPDRAADAASALTGASAVALSGVWTHLATPEEPSTTDRQLARFASVLRQFDAAGIDAGAVHAAASGGLLAADVSDHAFVRPGLALYGIHPGAGEPLPPSVAPAIAVRAHPVHLAEVPSGTSVGYAGTWTAERTSTIATLPLGYADGWSRSSAPGTSILVRGCRAPVVGRVSSDALTVDVTGIDGVDLDSEFTLLGQDGDDEITAIAALALRTAEHMVKERFNQEVPV